MSRKLVLQIEVQLLYIFIFCLEFLLQNYEGCLLNISLWTILIKSNGNLTDILYNACASPSM